MARRGAWRLLLETERVQALLGELRDVARQLLCWHYADQLTFPQMAAVLFGDSLHADTARAAVRQAYTDLCRVLQSHGLTSGPGVFPFPQ